MLLLLLYRAFVKFLFRASIVHRRKSQIFWNTITLMALINHFFNICDSRSLSWTSFQKSNSNLKVHHPSLGSSCRTAHMWNSPREALLTASAPQGLHCRGARLWSAPLLQGSPHRGGFKDMEHLLVVSYMKTDVSVVLGNSRVSRFLETSCSTILFQSHRIHRGK